MTWEDVLVDWKCGGERERKVFVPKVGTAYKHYYCGDFVEVITVTEENLARVTALLNDVGNDMDDYERV